jgi:hypothetical protein
LKGGEKQMKKFILSIVAVAVILGVGVGIKHSLEECGNPPVGGSPSPITVGFDFTPDGNPPVGG